MGSCIICGTAVDGEVCDVHQEDVGFVFEGTSPDQLTPNRYYRGTVDGYADFGVFVDIGDSVTGLLHQSELDQRLESLDWEPGDEVFVQVTGVRDNGNVDLAWSIRQDEREFRGLLVDSPDGERRYESESESDTATKSDAAPSGGKSSGNEHVRQRQSDGGKTPAPAREATSGGADGGDAASESAEEPVSDDASSSESAKNGAAASDTGGSGAVAATAEPEPTSIDALDDADGDLVRLEGEVVGIQQTGGPTIFELRDGSGTVDCAAFDGAGVRAYPDVEVGDVVRLDGTVERRRGDLQIETESLDVLDDEAASEVTERVDAAMAAAVRPDAAQFIADDDPAAPLADGIVEAATTVRRALAEDRPVVLRHPATADGYAAGAAIERGAFARARADAEGAEPDYHVVHRRPLDDPLYGMDAATSDLTRMLQDRERHGEQLPLIVLVGVGSSTEAQEAVELLDVYGVDRVVLDTAQPDEGVETVGDPVVNPHLAGIETDLSNAALGAALGATVGDPDVVEELAHVPAIGYWEDLPGAYLAAAEDAGYDEAERNAIREALALEAHYQRYNDKRELVADLLFDGAPGLAEHVAEQFREKLDTEVTTARDNLVVRETGGVRFAVLDTDAFTHRFDFPPTELLLDELHRRERDEATGAVVTIGAGEDELLVRSTQPVDVRAIAAAADDAAGIEAVGGADGHLEYLPGDRDAAIEAVVGALASSIEA